MFGMSNMWEGRLCLPSSGHGERFFSWFSAVLLCLLSITTLAYRYDPALVDWNLNENQYALSATVSDRHCG